MWERFAFLAALLAALAVAGDAVVSVSNSNLRDSMDSYVTAYINVTYMDDKGNRRSDRSEIAKFGDGRVEAAGGLLVHAKSINSPGACEPPLVPTHGKLPSGPWVALLKRGHCTFDTKVHNAALSRAVAVIVYDDKESDTLDMMDLSPEHNITAVLTYRWKGLNLVDLLESGKTVYVQISIANRCTRPLNSINRTSVLFVSVSFIVLMIISLAWLVFYYVQRFRYIHAKDRLSRRLCSAAKRALSKIPTRRLKMDDPEVTGECDCCAICIERYRVSDVVRALPCRHEFHKSCIDPWLLEHRTCPMCKMDILKHYGFVFTGSQESILHFDIEEVADIGLGESDIHNIQRSGWHRIILHMHHEQQLQHQEQSLPSSHQQQQTDDLRQESNCQHNYQQCLPAESELQQHQQSEDQPHSDKKQSRPKSPGAISSNSSSSGVSGSVTDSMDSMIPSDCQRAYSPHRSQDTPEEITKGTQCTQDSSS